MRRLFPVFSLCILTFLTISLGDARISEASASGDKTSPRAVHKLLIESNPFNFSSLASTDSITLVMDHPVANDDSFPVHGNAVALPSVLNNDTPPAGGNFSGGYSSLVTMPSHGSLTSGGQGQYTYRRTGNFLGVDSFTYIACTSSGNCSTNAATVTINVYNGAPTVNSDFYRVGSWWTPVYFNLFANDSDPEGDHFSLSDGLVCGTLHGTITHDAEQLWSFHRSVGDTWSGYVGCSYRVVDDLGAYSGWTAVGFWLLPIADAINAGWSCPIGEPVNTTNGNMWLRERDFSLPGIGENIEVNRFYNSILQSNGLFGLGWSTKYDEYIEIFSDGGHMLGLHLPDGRAEYYGRSDTSGVFTNLITSSGDQITKNPDNSYTVTYKDGRVHQFDSVGKLLWQKDRNGNQTTLTYDASNHLTGITDPVGRTLTLTPNTNGTISQISDTTGVIATYTYISGTTRLQQVTYPDGSKYKFEYTTISGSTYLATVKDALDNILETHQYDSSGRATTSEKHGGVEKYTFSYTNSTYTTVTDTLGRVTKYYFDKSKFKNVVTKIEGVCGCGGSGSQLTNYQYDTKLNLVKKTDALGHDTNYTYNSTGDLLSQQDVLGTETYTYNALGEVLTATDRMGGVTTNTYSTSGNLLTSQDALNNTATLTYTSIGQLATVQDALSHTTTLTYDTASRLTGVTDANNKTTNIAYDARVRPTSVTNALSETTSFEYDLNNRLKKVTYPDTNFITYTYDLAGRRTAATDARNNTTTYAYDNDYRVTGITDALTHSTTFGYDLMSNLTSQTDALSNTTNYQYDDFNRLTKVTYPPATTGATRLEENLTYDTVGNVKTRVDTAARTTSYDYDTSNRLIKITDPLSQITQFEYNARSQMTKVTDALSQQYTFTYDPLGRELSQTRASSTMSFEYDAVGNRTKRTDYIGQVTNYQYDNLNRLTEILYGSTVGASYAYDDLSRLLSAANVSGTVGFTYDNRGREKTETDVFGHVIEHGYDANGNRNLLKLDSVNYASYAYDNADRLTSITNSADSTNVTYGYDNANRLTSRGYPNSVNTTYSYDGMSRLTRLKDLSATATLFDRQYSYNTANQISQIVEPAQTRTFGYDNVDRLTSVTDSVNGNENYTFDAVGNRTASHRSGTYGYQPFNRLTSTSTAAYSYDANGNMPVGAGSYTWDFENRMITATYGTSSVTYEYDALGRRTKRMDGATSTKFTYDGQDVLMDDDLVSGITKYQNGPGIDNKLRQTNGSATSYFLGDHLGSTNGLTDSTGGLTATNSYDSFGNATNAAFPTRYQFTGREYDSFTGLQYNRARFYDSNLGRFISEDPIGFGGGDINLYGYVRNQPTAFRDPTGKIIPIIAVVVIGGAVVLILTSPSYVNAPGPGDRVYDSHNDLVANAVMGAAGGTILSKVLGPIVGPILSRLFPEEAPVACEIVSSAADDVGKSFKSFTKYNFRDNLAELTGELPADAQAHHVFPQRFGSDFQKVGIDIHDPHYGAWWETTGHQSNWRPYNAAWEEFLSDGPNQQQIFDFGRQIMSSHGLSVNY
jgi:RHS repeat-associated protein